MYNNELKYRFLTSNCYQDNTIEMFKSLFNATEPYELELNMDICEVSFKEFSNVVSSIFKNKKFMYRERILFSLKSYVEWCRDNSEPVKITKDEMISIKTSDFDVKNDDYIANPLGLKKYLDDVYTPEDCTTTDLTQRGYCWLAYMGFSESEMLSLKTSDVDIENRIIKFNGRTYKIFEESLKTFRYLKELNEFVYQHKLYKNSITRNRVPGDALLRGVRSVNCNALRVEVSKNNSNAIKNGTTTKRIRIKTLKLSGEFYEIYRREQAGYEPDFSNIVLSEVPKDASNKVITNKLREMRNNYAIWKQSISN